MSNPKTPARVMHGMHMRQVAAKPAKQLVRFITMEEALHQLRLEHAGMPPAERPGPTDTVVLARRRWPHLRNPKAVGVTLTRAAAPSMQPDTMPAALKILEQEAQTLGRPAVMRTMLLEARRRWPKLRGAG